MTSISASTSRLACALLALAFSGSRDARDAIRDARERRDALGPPPRAVTITSYYDSRDVAHTPGIGMFFTVPEQVKALDGDNAVISGLTAKVDHILSDGNVGIGEYSTSSGNWEELTYGCLGEYGANLTWCYSERPSSQWWIAYSIDIPGGSQTAGSGEVVTGATSGASATEQTFQYTPGDPDNAVLLYGLSGTFLSGELLDGDLGLHAKALTPAFRYVTTYYAADPSNLTAGDVVIGAASGARATISSIIIDSGTQTLTLHLSGATKRFSPGEHWYVAWKNNGLIDGLTAP